MVKQNEGEKKVSKYKYICFALLVLLACMPAAVAQGVSGVDTVSTNNKLQDIASGYSHRLAYNPEVTPLENLGIVDQSNRIAKYYAEIQVGSGPYNRLPITLYMKEGLGPQDIKGISYIFTGQCLSGKDSFYDADYSTISGAAQGQAVVVLDRREVNIPMSTSTADANVLLKYCDVGPTTTDYFLQIAASDIIVSQMTGVPVGTLKKSVIGHSLGADALHDYCLDEYQKSDIGHIDNTVYVDTVFNYDSEYENFRIGQEKSYYEIKQQIDSGDYTVSDMKNSILLVNVALADFTGLSRKAVRYGLGETYRNMDYPFTATYSYWTYGPDGTNGPLAGGQEDLIMQRIADGAAVPYSSKRLDLQMTGKMAGIIPIQKPEGVKALAVLFDNGFGRSGEDCFRDTLGAEIYYGGDGGHGSLMYDSRYSAATWNKIWSWIDQQNN